MTGQVETRQADIDQRGGVFAPQFDVLKGTDTNRFRRARFLQFLRMIEEMAKGRDKLRILDIGGSPGFWMGVEDLWRHLPLEITMVNIGAEDQDRPPFLLRVGNACSLTEYADHSFDIVHSNSVIEHVGHWREMMAMAAEVRRLAPAYWLQTPNFWFPYEPHLKTFFIHWLPETTKASMLLRRPRGWRSADTFDKAMMEVQDLNLLSARQLSVLFPDAQIRRERIGPFAKSLIAARWPVAA